MKKRLNKSRLKAVRIGIRYIFIAIAWSSCLFAQELGATVGGLRSTSPSANTYAWQVFYWQPISQTFGASFSWTNEGHLPNHHRDGCSLQGWYCFPEGGSGFSVAFGLGLYNFYDTIPDGDGGHQNRHGLGAQATLQGLYTPPKGPWSLVAQLVATHMPGEIGSTSFQVGSSYRFGKASGSSRHSRPRVSELAPENVLGIFAGRTVLNSLQSQTDEAWGVEFRRAISRHWAISATFSEEGDTLLLRRRGVSLQAWLGGSPADQFYLGVGAGPHLARIVSREQPHGETDAFNRLGFRISMGAGWRFHPEWMWRSAWHRTYSSYHRDTDMFVTGIGYLW